MWLWIAFKIVFFAVVDSPRKMVLNLNLVVNCFQNCIFRCRWQHLWRIGWLHICCELLSKLYFSLSLTAMHRQDYLTYSCELLSKLYFSLSLTAGTYDVEQVNMLWIAFKIVFFAVVDSLSFILIHLITVVNCFQNCIFRCRWQQPSYTSRIAMGCELLSKLYFSLSLTASSLEILTL